MKFITHALIGIALYEAARYLLRKDDWEYTRITYRSPATARTEDDTAGLATRPYTHRPQINNELRAGTDPEAPLTGYTPDNDQHDPWKKSLADDDLRAPDS